MDIAANPAPPVDVPSGLERALFPDPAEQLAEDPTFDPRTDRQLLLALLADYNAMRDVINGQSKSLNWLTEKTANLFGVIDQMNAAGGPMALLGAMRGNGNG